MTSIAPEIPASIAHLLADADVITAARTLEQQRAYLASKGSVYATSPDDGMVIAAFLGWAVGTMDDLARTLRQELASRA